MRDQTEKILASGTTEGVQVADRPIVLVTIRGAKSGKLRYTPVMRVEHDGRYAMFASKGGAPEHPAWYHNLVANPHVELQDGTETKEYDARELSGAERASGGTGRRGLPAVRGVPDEDRPADPRVPARATGGLKAPRTVGGPATLPS